MKKSMWEAGATVMAFAALALSACGPQAPVGKAQKLFGMTEATSPDGNIKLTFGITEGDSVPTFSDQIRAFYRQILGEEPTDEEMKILESAAREAGVED